MESKKINQLATELAPDLSDLTIIGDPTTGISKKITLSQMASLFTGTVEEYANLAAFPLVGVADTIYVAKDTNVIYRWDSTAYVVLSPNVIASLVFNDANGFDGTIALVGSVATLTITTALTSGSVPFIGASGALTQDNANLFFDDTNNRLGIATASPTTPLDVFGSGIIGRLNATSTNNSYLGFASNGTNKWSVGNVQSDHRFRIFSEANSAELVSVLQTGEFGIGIANPTTKLHIDGGASALIANLDANVSVAKSISFRSDNSNRINLEVSGTESGSNAGANFYLRAYTDAGALLSTPLTIVRSTGEASFSSNVSATKNFISVPNTDSISVGTNASENAKYNYVGHSGYWGIKTTTTGFNFAIDTYNGGTPQNVLTITQAGAATFLSSITAIRGTMNGTDGDYAFFINGGATVGNSYGLRINAGGNGSDYAIRTKNAAQTSDLFVVKGNGVVGIGLTTGTGKVYIKQTSAFAYEGLNVYASSNDAFVGIGHTGSLAVVNSSYNSTAAYYPLAFFTSDTERMRITSAGVFKATTDSTYDSLSGTANEFNQSVNDWVLVTRNKATSPYGIYIKYSAGAPNGTGNEFIYCTDSTGVIRANIRSNGGLANFQANNVNLSDERTKKDIIPLESYWNKFKSIEIVKFKYKDQTHDDFNIGVIAQQVESVAPEFVDIDGWDTKPKLDEEGNEIISEEEPLKSVYTSDLHHATIKVLQEAMAKIEILEEEVKILKTK
jgi:hypothetical protein